MTMCEGGMTESKRPLPSFSKAEQYSSNMAELPDGVVEEWSMPDCTGYCHAFLELPDGRVDLRLGDWITTSITGERHVYSPYDLGSVPDPVTVLQFDLFRYKLQRAYGLMLMVQRHQINAHEAANRMYDIGIYGGDLEELVEREQKHDMDLVENPDKVRVAPEDCRVCED